jgi:hypothetical protein
MAHPLSDAMVGMTAEERAAYKAAHYGSMATPTLNVNIGRMVSIVEGPTLVNGMVRVVLALWIDNGGGNWELIDLGDANPFYFKNPPILVPDPGGDIERTWTTVEPNIVTGRLETVTHSIFLREDPDAALEQMCYDAVERFTGSGGVI